MRAIFTDEELNPLAEACEPPITGDLLSAVRVYLVVGLKHTEAQEMTGVDRRKISAACKQIVFLWRLQVRKQSIRAGKLTI